MSIWPSPARECVENIGLPVTETFGRTSAMVSEFPGTAHARGGADMSSRPREGRTDRGPGLWVMVSPDGQGEGYGVAQVFSLPITGGSQRVGNVGRKADDNAQINQSLLLAGLPGLPARPYPHPDPLPGEQGEGIFAGCQQSRSSLE